MKVVAVAENDVLKNFISDVLVLYTKRWSIKENKFFSTANEAMGEINNADVLICGVEIPGEINGLELIVKAKMKNQSLIVITMSGSPRYGDKALESGADHFIYQQPDILGQLKKIMSSIAYKHSMFEGLCRVLFR